MKIFKPSIIPILTPLPILVHHVCMTLIKNNGYKVKYAADLHLVGANNGSSLEFVTRHIIIFYTNQRCNRL
ncbi:MAG: hypothetical protein ACI9EX_000047 [Oleispira sp.]|jgi:hypothetical protein